MSGAVGDCAAATHGETSTAAHNTHASERTENDIGMTHLQ
jgi:hypothetical protein